MYFLQAHRIPSCASLCHLSFWDTRHRSEGCHRAWWKAGVQDQGLILRLPFPIHQFLWLFGNQSDLDFQFLLHILHFQIMIFFFFILIFSWLFSREIVKVWFDDLVLAVISSPEGIRISHLVTVHWALFKSSEEASTASIQLRLVWFRQRVQRVVQCVGSGESSHRGVTKCGRVKLCALTWVCKQTVSQLLVHLVWGETMSKTNVMWARIKQSSLLFLSFCLHLPNDYILSLIC